MLNIKTILFILLVLFFVPILLGKVDASQVWNLIQNPASWTNLQNIKIVLLDLVNDVINFYKYPIINWLQGINVPAR